MDLFRAICGVLLVLYFARGALELSPLLEAGFLGDALAHTTLRSLSALGIRGLFVCGCAAALCIALGVAVRAAAATLLFLSVALCAGYGPTAEERCASRKRASFVTRKGH